MVCTVCWTDSWEPVEPGYPDAIPDPHVPGGFMRCGYCFLHEAIAARQTKIDKSRQMVSDFVKTWVENFSIERMEGQEKLELALSIMVLDKAVRQLGFEFESIFKEN